MGRRRSNPHMFFPVGAREYLKPYVATVAGPNRSENPVQMGNVAEESKRDF